MKQNKEVIFSVVLYIVCYSLVLLSAILWSTGLKLFSLEKFGNFLQFLAAIMAISSFVQEKRLSQAEDYLQKVLFWFLAQKPFHIIINAQKKYLSWVLSVLKKAFSSLNNIAVLAGIGVLFYLIATTWYFSNNPNSAFTISNECRSVITRVKLLDVSAIFQHPHCLSYILFFSDNIISGLLFILGFWLPLKFLMASKRAIKFGLFIAMIPFLFYLFIKILIFLGFYITFILFGLIATLAISLILFIPFSLFIIIIIVALSLILVALLPWRYMETISKSLSITKKSKIGLISIFTAFLGIIGSLLALLS